MYTSVSEVEYVYEHMHICVHVCKDERVVKWYNYLLVSLLSCKSELLYIYKHVTPHHGA